MLADVLETGLRLLIPAATAATWVSVLLLFLVDRRAGPLRFEVVLSFAVVCGAGHLAVREGITTTVAVCWFVAAATGVVHFLARTRIWLQQSDRQLHEERRETEATRSKKNAKRASLRMSKRRGDASAAPARNLWAVGVCAVGSIASLAAMVLSAQVSSVDPGLERWLAIFNVIVGVVTLGLALVTAIEVTFLCNPDALLPSSGPSVNWLALSRLASLTFLSAMALNAYIVLQMSSMELDSGPNEIVKDQIVASVYALSVSLLFFVAWMVPHRVSVFQRKGGATQWAWLALAAWLACLSFTVLFTLPASWPWKLL